MHRVLLVDDHPIFLDGLRQFVESYDGFEVVCAQSAEAAHGEMQHQDFDLLVLDITIIDGGGMDILRSVRATGSNVPVIFLTVHITPVDTVEAMRLGINGIILKESSPVDIMKCIETVLGGETSLDPTITEKALQHFMDAPSETPQTTANLTVREREIVNLVSQGLRNKEIGDQCGLTEGTVKTHLHNIFGKLGVKSRTQLLIALDQSPTSSSAD